MIDSVKSFCGWDRGYSESMSIKCIKTLLLYKNFLAVLLHFVQWDLSRGLRQSGRRYWRAAGVQQRDRGEPKPQLRLGRCSRESFGRRNVRMLELFFLVFLSNLHCCMFRNALKWFFRGTWLAFHQLLFVSRNHSVFCFILVRLESLRGAWLIQLAHLETTWSMCIFGSLACWSSR